MGISSVNKRKRDFQATFPQTDGAGDVDSPGLLLSVKSSFKVVYGLFLNVVYIYAF